MCAWMTGKQTQKTRREGITDIIGHPTKNYDHNK